MFSPLSLRYQIVASSHVADVNLDIDKVASGSIPGWRIKTVETTAGRMGTLAVKFSNAELAEDQANTLNRGLAIAIGGTAMIALVGFLTDYALTRRLRLVTEGGTKARGCPPQLGREQHREWPHAESMPGARQFRQSRIRLHCCDDGNPPAPGVFPECIS